jgi:dolichol kinase
MDKGEMFRKGFHLCAPLFLLYYAVPSDMWGLGPTREIVLLAVLTMVLVFDAMRYGMGVTLPFLRSYEERRISAYSWAAIGFTMAIIFFPTHLVVPVIFGLGWTDPLIGLLRRRRSRLYPALPVIAYFAICAVAFALMGFMGIFHLLVLSAVGAVTAVAVEFPRLRHVDDDFLMQVVPLAAMWAVEYAWMSLL